MKKILIIILLFPITLFAQKFNVKGVGFVTTPTPSINNSTSSLTSFVTNQGTASSPQSFTTSGSNLTAGGSVTAGSGFEISLDGSTYSSSLSLSLSSGGFAGQPVTIFVRLSASATAGTYNSNVTVSSTGATPQPVACSGTVNSITPTLTLTGSYSAFSTTSGVASAAQTITVSGSNLTADCSVTWPTGFEGSIDGTNYSTNLTITHSGTSLVGQPVTVYTRISSTAAVGSPSGNVAFSSTGATTKNAAVNGTVISSTGNDTTKVNIIDSSGNAGLGVLSLSDWNNWSVVYAAATPVKSAPFKNSTGTTTTIQAYFSNTHFSVDNGSGYNSGTTQPIPVLAFRIAAVNTTNGPDTLVLTGLPTRANGYKFILGGSRVNTGTNVRNMTVTETISGATQTKNAIGLDTPFVLDNLTPSGGVLKFVITDDTGFWYVNWFEIIGKP